MTSDPSPTGAAVRPVRTFRLPFTPDRPLLYLHVPKCGGTSVNTLLRRAFPADGIRWLAHHRAAMAGNATGLGCHPCYSGHVNYGFRDLLPPAATVATFLRDPVDRAVSAFYYFRSLGRPVLTELLVTPGLERCCDLSLVEFLRAEPHAARVNLGNVQTWMFSQPQMYHVPPWRPLTRADLDEARRNLEATEFVGLTERIAEGVALLCRACDWPAPDAVPHANRTPDRAGIGELEPEARAALEELTALDAEFYRHGEALFADALRNTPLPLLPPAPAATAVTFDGPIPGSGWHDREPCPGGYFCWTGRSAWLEVRLAGDGELAVGIEIRGAVEAAQLDGLAVAVNGRPVDLTRSRVGDADRFEGRLAFAPQAGGRFRVELRVPRAVRPCDVWPESPDRRELGVAVSRVEVGFVGQSSAASPSRYRLAG